MVNAAFGDMALISLELWPHGIAVYCQPEHVWLAMLDGEWAPSCQDASYETLLIVLNYTERKKFVMFQLALDTSRIHYELCPYGIGATALA